MRIVKQWVKEACLTGINGKDTSKAQLLTSSEPLPNEMIKIKKLYWVCIIVIGLGFLITPLLAWDSWD